MSCATCNELRLKYYDVLGNGIEKPEKESKSKEKKPKVTSNVKDFIDDPTLTKAAFTELADRYPSMKDVLSWHDEVTPDETEADQPGVSVLNLIWVETSVCLRLRVDEIGKQADQNCWNVVCKSIIKLCCEGY